MIENKYEVFINGSMYASKMTLETAAILIKGLFNEYYRDTEMEVTVKKMKESEEDVD